MKVWMLFFFISGFAFADFRKFNEPVENTLPYFMKEELEPIWDISKTEENKLVKISKHELEDQFGNKFNSINLKGKVSALSFFFATCSGYCPVMTRNIKRAFTPLKEDKNILFLSYSVTPNKDTISVLNEYADKYGINGKNWHLLRGSREVIYNFARNELFADMALDLKKGEDQFVHSEKVYLVDKKLFVRGIYNGNKPRDMEKLLKDMMKLKKGKSDS